MVNSFDFGYLDDLLNFDVTGSNVLGRGTTSSLLQNLDSRPLALAEPPRMSKQALNYL
jgi:hypothetical protein